MATAMPYNSLATFVESPVFSRLLPGYMDDDAYTTLQWALALHPEAGAVISGSGGVCVGREAGVGNEAVCALFITGTNARRKYGC